MSGFSAVLSGDFVNQSLVSITQAEEGDFVDW